jgi:uncharacterized repeat protein (TIGR01451 family)
MKKIGFVVLLAVVGVLPVFGDACDLLPVSPAGQLGCSVALHGGAQRAAALGAHMGGDAQAGLVTICRFGAKWDCSLSLTPPDGQAGDQFGRSVAIDDDWLAVGAPFAKGSGVIYLYRRGEAAPAQELSASNGARGDQFGLTLALSGRTLIVGAPNAVGHGGSLSGAVYVFHLDGETWKENQILTASDAKPFDNFGFSLAIDGSLAIVGAPFHDRGNVGNAGAAYVLELAGGTWTQQFRLTAGDGAADDEFGSAVAVSGTAVTVGARAADARGRDSGAAYVFERNGQSWPEKVRFAGEAAGDRFGVAAAMSGDKLVVGALLNGGTGAAYLYERQDSEWIQTVKRVGNDAGDRFGQAVSTDETGALIGAYLAQSVPAQVCQYSQHERTADLGISLSAPASIQPGQILTYTLMVTNQGPDPAPGARFQLTIPAGLTPVADTLPGGCMVGSRTIDCSADLTVRENRAIPLRFTVPETCLPVIRSSAMLLKSATDPNPANDSSQVVSTAIVRQADLAVTALPGLPYVRPGAQLSFHMRATNKGPDIACGVVVVDTLPAGLRRASLGLPEGCEIVGNELHCATAELTSGSAYEISVELTAAQGCGGSIVNSAKVSATPPTSDPIPRNNSLTVKIPLATDISIAESGLDIAKPGELLFYRIEVGNPDGCKVTVNGTFPETLQNVRWCREVDPVHCNPSIAGNLADVVTGPATYRVRGDVPPDFLGELANKVTAQGPPEILDVDLTNNSTMHPTQILQLDDIPALSSPALAILAGFLALTALRRLRRQSSL